MIEEGKQEPAISVDSGAAVTMEVSNESKLECRDTTKRPVLKLSVNLIETYKYINKVYYDAKAKKQSAQSSEGRGGVHNGGLDDQHYDYIVKNEELCHDRYILKHRIGKVSGQYFSIMICCCSVGIIVDLLNHLYCLLSYCVGFFWTSCGCV